MKTLHLNNTIGRLGEDIAETYLKKQGFSIKIRNYLQKTGEIDIVAEKEHRLYFVEVKAFSVQNLDGVEKRAFRPEHNVTFHKMEKMKRTILWYMAEQKVTHETAFEIVILSVYIHEESKKAKVVPMWNVIV